MRSKQIALGDSRVASFREADPEDEDFLVEVYGSTRLQEMALVDWGPDQRDAFLRMQFNAQSAHYKQYYPEGEHLIILVDGERVGRLYVANIQTEMRILDITVVPPRRNAGIGTSILRELMAEAARLGKPVSIYVESYNRSRGLFERLGFEKTGEHGYSYLLEWRARPEGETP